MQVCAVSQSLLLCKSFLACVPISLQGHGHSYRAQSYERHRVHVNGWPEYHVYLTPATYHNIPDLDPEDNSTVLCRPLPSSTASLGMPWSCLHPLYNSSAPQSKITDQLCIFSQASKLHPGTAAGLPSVFVFLVEPPTANESLNELNRQDPSPSQAPDPRSAVPARLASRMLSGHSLLWGPGTGTRLGDGNISFWNGGRSCGGCNVATFFS